MKTLITSALPYVNNVPHLGNLVCIVSADAYTRFLRSKGENVISVLGTDEHGTTAEVKALEEGITPRELVDKYFKIHKRIYEWFECGFDCFGRTSSKQNWEITQGIFKKLYKNSCIIKQTVRQAHCQKCNRFLADRYIIGECPKCGYKEARGDQCESCGKLLNPEELKEAKCKICGQKPEFKESEHLFIDLQKIETKLRKWVSKAEKNWSQNAKTMTQAWLKEGLKPRAITRDLQWGIKVPLEGFENKVFYSWFDAPIGYISITAECRKDWKNWWRGKTRLVQFMGKDNIPFHTILFPSFLIGTGENWTLVNSLSVNEYLNYEGGMFSKSRGIGVFGDDATDSGIPADVWRYYLMINRPETADTEFTWQDFQEKNNNELVANIGNLVNRTMVFIERYYKGKIPEITKKELNYEKEVKKIEELMEKIELKKALKEIMLLSKKGNNYFQKKEPWKNPEESKNVIASLAVLIKDLSILIQPFMPETSRRIQEQLGTKELKWKDIRKMVTGKAGKPEHLFSKIEDDELERMKCKYGGKKMQEFPLNLKIAKILKVEKHPNADKLYLEQIDLGTEKRQIISGLAGYYTPEELVGKNIIVVANLKPATLRGIESKGMLLAADDGKNVVLLEAPNSKPGDAVYIEGHRNSEKEISYEEFSKIKMVSKDKKVVVNGKTLRTDTEEVMVDIYDNAPIK